MSLGAESQQCLCLVLQIGTLITFPWNICSVYRYTAGGNDASYSLLQCRSSRHWGTHTVSSPYIHVAAVRGNFCSCQTGVVVLTQSIPTIDHYNNKKIESHSTFIQSRLIVSLVASSTSGSLQEAGTASPPHVM